MYVIVWEFTIREECIADFEAIYGSQGEWAQLFARAEGYGNTRLLRDTSDPLGYITLDFWASQKAYDQFRQAQEQEYRTLDERCERLTVKETRLGEFVTD
jgi:heme-degrading monooxygenase HmoA